MGSCKLCERPDVVYTSIISRKIKFIAYIYIHFYPEFYKTYKLKLNQKNIYTQFYYKQRNTVIDVITSPNSSQIVEDHGLFWRHLPSCDVAWLDVIIET